MQEVMVANKTQKITTWLYFYLLPLRLLNNTQAARHVTRRCDEKIEQFVSIFVVSCCYVFQFFYEFDFLDDSAIRSLGLGLNESHHFVVSHAER